MMKKIFLLLIMFPTILFSQENMKKSAEDFMTGYIKLFEEKKCDIIPSMYAEDAQLIWPDGKVMPLIEAMKPFLDKYEKESASVKIDVKWIQIDVTGPNSVMVTTNLINTTNRTGNIEVYLLERKDDIWKIKKDIANWNFPLINNENIEKKYQIDNIAAITTLDLAINQRWYAMFYDIDYFKKNGTSPVEYGKILATMYTKGWDKSKGFEGLFYGFILNCKILSKYVELMERNETTFKVRFIPPVIGKEWNFTREDLLNFNINIWSEIADYMGANCTMVDEGKYWILTVKKK
ncbi:MAG: hypothetical protein VB024_09895 [Dysgonamonadaceae bacterium]|nr:hypothetical protein [Dysgonamonadaceae bacterium]